MIAHIIRFEGGYANDKSDPGGATAYGVASYYNKEVAAKIRSGTFTIEDAFNVYRQRYWMKILDDMVEAKFSPIAFLILDSRVSGHKEVRQLLEYTFGRLGLSSSWLTGRLGSLKVLSPSGGRARILSHVLLDQKRFLYHVARSAANRSMNAQRKRGLPLKDYFRSFYRRSALRYNYAFQLFKEGL